uniref:Uncharacterized protein n=1 Tax=Arundo donax TaxID=35708 RepID=A0A0A9B736_ARUDO
MLPASSEGGDRK